MKYTFGIGSSKKKVGLLFCVTRVRIKHCVIPENICIPPGGSQKFLGVGRSKRDKFPKGRGVHKEFFCPESLKCNRINTYILLQIIDSRNKEKRKVLSVKIDVI